MIFRTILGLLTVCGLYARILLPFGVVIALLLPSNGAFFKPATPFILAILVGCAFVRLDIGAALKAAFRPQRLFRNFAVSLGLLLVLPILLFTILKWCGMSNAMLPLVTWYSVAPPVGTTIWMCVLLGLTAPIAMEIVLLTNLLAPFTGPFLGEFLLGASTPVSSATLCLRILTILSSGFFLAILAKYTLGEDRIEESRYQFDGVSTIAMLAFLLPVFDGIGAMAVAEPLLACACLGLAFGLNFGTQGLVFILSRLLLRCKNFGPAKRARLLEGNAFSCRGCWQP